MAKVQTQLLVTKLTRDRMDALALVRGEVRAEVSRALIDRALPLMEKEHKVDLERLAKIARDIGTTQDELVRRMAADGYTLADLEGRKRYPAAPKA